jgi:hypothetical protein
LIYWETTADTTDGGLLVAAILALFALMTFVEKALDRTMFCKSDDDILAIE